MNIKRRKIVNRREFLKGAATLGCTALTARLLGSVAAPAQAGAGGLERRIYLPAVSGQRSSVSTAPAGPSKLGLHTLRADGAESFVRDVYDAGACVALVKGVDEFGYLRMVKTISPETVTIGRSNVVQAMAPSGDPADAAVWLMDQHMPKWQWEADIVDYWEIQNENDPPTVAGHVWLAEVYIAAMQIAEENGHKLAIFSYSTGVPQWHEWEAIVETGVFARAKAGGHILALHEYGWPTTDNRWGEATEDLPPYEDRGVLTGRYRYLYRDFLIPRGEVIPLAITESGLDPLLENASPGDWKRRYVDNMIWYDTRLREDDYVIGATMFTLGPYGAWEDYDYEELLWPGHSYGGQNFLDYIVSLG
ncbi:MAG: twin-arginine translocation signal domain-containing protein [Chloroflexota bacterium]|nr:twin-arginine translocation signal domain-containing protein [Chloroflexota bacterium]